MTQPGGSGAGEPRVLIVTAAMGAGHTEVAAELARRLDAKGAYPRVVELLGLTGRPGARLRNTYRFLLARAPWVYDAAMRFWQHCPGPLQAVTAAGAGPFERALAGVVAEFRPDVIVSTFNLSSQSLGRMVARGQVGAPVVTFVVDPGAHPYWVSHHVDLHLATTSATAAVLTRYGAAHVVVASPVLRPEFTAPPSRLEARTRLGWPGDARIVLLNAGSWAVGRVERTLDVVRGGADLMPVVLCGRDERLRQRVQRRPGVRAVPWTSQIAPHLAAADVVIDNAGGLTCWESLACGTPVVIFRPLPGHGKVNAGALEQAHLARWVRTPAELVPAVRELAAAPPEPPVRSPFSGGDAVAQILAVARGVRA